MLVEFRDVLGLFFLFMVVLELYRIFKVLCFLFLRVREVLF